MANWENLLKLVLETGLPVFQGFEGKSENFDV